ncbi:hypothetical protein F2Q70_00038651 [Brassica cretica]|uniref:Uncharacterized protein n=1 Tax=Brassica cretica TaxID=69181 RepID=A0A8S9K290_BRACR|nr:hypothetical protein F2Q70_00038651 [Brassica cretica]KAF2620662.1 hypothetical protein F2Q68_00039303 [Brassica cretica]
MLDGEANQTAVRKLIQECYMEDSSGRSLVSTSNSPKADFGMASGDIVVDAHQKELERVISKVKVDIHGSFVSMSSSIHP